MAEQVIIKYPRTPHLEGSRLQPGDEDLSQIPFAELAGRHLVVEEKCDGANSAVSFSADGELLLQSRGHYLTGGYRERHFNLMKQWAAVHKDVFYRVLGSRYISSAEGCTVTTRHVFQTLQTSGIIDSSRHPWYSL